MLKNFFTREVLMTYLPTFEDLLFLKLVYFVKRLQVLFLYVPIKVSFFENDKKLEFEGRFYEFELDFADNFGEKMDKSIISHTNFSPEKGFSIIY